MNNHLRRVQEESESFRKKRKLEGYKILYVFALCMIVAVIVSQFAPDTLRSKSTSTPSATELSPPPTAAPGDAWWLILVNANQPLPHDFTVDLETVSGGRVDTRIAQPLLQMLADAEDAGISLRICSAYRNVAQQTALYQKKIQFYQNRGFSKDESIRQAKQVVQSPGASEHHTGLAIDFLTDSTNGLTEAFAETSACIWLVAHAADYGFIERYPQEKKALTGITWEPWHYRYVGVETAQAICASGLCLEEYIAQLQQEDTSINNLGDESH